jgi:polyvinyl alcohol dehydrogenase (cytochrome)
VLAFAAGAFARQADAPRDPASLFASDCATCHHADDPRAPSAEVLRGRSPQAIVDALTSGSMRYQGLSLSGAERRAIAEFLTGKKLRGSVTGAVMGRCAGARPLGDPATGPLWNGWGPTPLNTHFQTAAQAGLTAAQVPQLKLKWAFGFPDAT